MTHSRKLKTSLLTVACLLFASFAVAEEPSEWLDKEPLEEIENPVQVVAELHFEDGKLTFIEETVRGVFGFGILEEGSIDLSPLYEQGATALEIYLALAPKGNEVPDALWQAHELARQQDPGVPSKPRDLEALVDVTALAKVPYYGFRLDTSNCWRWGGVGSYNSLVGNAPGAFGGHNSGQARNNFRNWSMIPNSNFNTSDSAFFNQNAVLSDQFYSTPGAHDRAVGMCVTHALVAPGENRHECSVRFGRFYNTVNYRATLTGRQGSQFWTVATRFLTRYGHGVRYRSTSTATRVYRLQVVDVSRDSHICMERYEVYLRSRFNPGVVGF